MTPHDIHQLVSVFSGHPASVLAFFSLGIVGGLHCVGMCVPLSLVVLQRNGRPIWSGLVAYHASRLATYAALGWLLATGGGALQAYIPTGLFVSVTIVLLFLYAAGITLPALPILPHPIRALLACAARQPTWIRGVALGLVTPLLPCGLLYGAIFAALAAPSPAYGALWMACFAAGTIAMMLLPTLGMQSILHSVAPRTLRGIVRILAGLAGLALAGMQLLHK